MPSPDDKWAQYEDKGDKWAQYAEPTEPEPSTYSKLTASYNPNVEEFAQKHPVFGPVVRFLDAAGGAAMATPESIYTALRHPVDTAKGAMESIAAWKDPNVRAGALSVLPEALGQGLGNVAGGEAIGAAAPKVPKVAKGAISKTLRNETGALRPITKVGAKVAGAAIGHATGIPEAGLVGYLTGPEILEGIVPKREPTIAPAVSVSKGPGPYTGPASVPKPAPPPKPAPTPKPAPPSPFGPGATSSEAPIGNAPLPPAPAGPAPTTVPIRAGGVPPPPTPEAPSMIITPEEAAKPLRVEGSYWSWKEPKLRAEVLKGSREAAIVYKQRFGDLPPGSSYVTDIGKGPTTGLYKSTRP